jgi:hypothetical protein
VRQDVATDVGKDAAKAVKQDAAPQQIGANNPVATIGGQGRADSGTPAELHGGQLTAGRADSGTPADMTGAANPQTPNPKKTGTAQTGGASRPITAGQQQAINQGAMTQSNANRAAAGQPVHTDEEIRAIAARAATTNSNVIASNEAAARANAEVVAATGKPITYWQGGRELTGYRSNGRTYDANGNEITGEFVTQTADGKYWRRNTDGTSTEIDEATFNAMRGAPIAQQIAANVSGMQQTVPGATGFAASLQTPDLKPILDQWRQAAEEQQTRSIDYATEKAITELQRAQEDAQQGFRTAQEQISTEEAVNKDNQALYAEARGDKGGIGAAQYDSIMNTAAINRQAVREQQTKLATDTWRQIADLRAQGEFDKADALLQVSQTYLSNLLSLEQWAANYGLNAAQFAESIREWQSQFDLSVGEVLGEYNGQPTLSAQQAEWNRALNEASVTGYYNGEPTYAREKNEQSALASVGTALLNAGIMPNADQLKAMNMSEEDAQALLMAAQAKASGGGGGLVQEYDPDSAMNRLFDKAHSLYPNNTAAAMDYIANHYKDKEYGLTTKPSEDSYKGWTTEQKAETYRTSWDTLDAASKRILTKAYEEAAAGAMMGGTDGKRLSLLDIATTIWANDPSVAGNRDVLDRIAEVLQNGGAN